MPRSSGRVRAAAPGAAVERDRGADHREFVALFHTDGAQVDDLRARGGADDPLEAMGEPPRRGAEMPHAVVVAPNPEGAMEAGGQVGRTAQSDRGREFDGLDR